MTRSVRAQAGALSLLAACFFVSGLLRAGDVVAALPADGAGGKTDVAARDPTQHAETSMPAAETVGLARELRRQRAELVRREAALKEREQLLGAIEDRVRKRIAELEAARDDLSSSAAVVARSAEQDVARLAEMYQRMKPKQAGRIFDSMEPQFAAGFLAELKPANAAGILASMKPERAYAVTLLLAGRSLEGK